MDAKDVRVAVSGACAQSEWEVSAVSFRKCCAKLYEPVSGVFIEAQWTVGSDAENIKSAVRLAIAIDGELAIRAAKQQERDQ